MIKSVQAPGIILVLGMLIFGAFCIKSTKWPIIEDQGSDVTVEYKYLEYTMRKLVVRCTPIDNRGHWSKTVTTAVLKLPNPRNTPYSK